MTSSAAVSPTSARASRASHSVCARSCSGDGAICAVDLLTTPSCRRRAKCCRDLACSRHTYLRSWSCSPPPALPTPDRRQCSLGLPRDRRCHRGIARATAPPAAPPSPSAEMIATAVATRGGPAAGRGAAGDTRARWLRCPRRSRRRTPLVATPDSGAYRLTSRASSVLAYRHVAWTVVRAPGSHRHHGQAGRDLAVSPASEPGDPAIRAEWVGHGRSQSSAVAWDCVRGS